jgi:hypothetical protein
MPDSNLTKYQKGVYCTGIKLLSNLLTTITSSNHDIKVLKPALNESHSSSTLLMNSPQLKILKLRKDICKTFLGLASFLT